MTSADIFCSACGARHPGDARFCSTCGTALRAPTESTEDDPLEKTARTVVTKTGEVVRDQAIGAGLGWVLGALGATIPAILLTITSGARSFGGWLLLTWPLTFAVAAITVLGMRVVKGPPILLCAAAILLAALWLGTTLTGAPLMMARQPEFGALGLGWVLGFLGRFHQVYGTGAFALSVLVGGVMGALAAQRVPDQAT